jgi:pyruvate dehydrogenase (quinone)
LAESVGMKGLRVEKPEDLHDALAAAFAHDGPALVDVVSARQELVMPPKTTVAEAKNFSLFMMRAVLDGRASELVDLVSVNWRR